MHGAIAETGRSEPVGLGSHAITAGINSAVAGSTRQHSVADCTRATHDRHRRNSDQSKAQATGRSGSGDAGWPGGRSVSL